MQATERIQLRTTPHAKALLEQASQQLGVSMSYFILDSAYQRASQTIKETTQITLNADEWQRAINRLETPPTPAPAMQALFDRGFGELAKANDRNKSILIRDFMRAYVKKMGSWSLNCE